MRLMYDVLSEPIFFDDYHVNTLIIENQKFFREFAEDLFKQIEGNEGNAVLSIDYTPVSIAKHTEILSDFASFNINKKRLINKIISALEKEATTSEYFIQTQQLVSDIERYILNISLNLPCNIVCDKISAATIIKMSDISLQNDYSNTLEAIVDYMELICEFDRDKLFIMLNMRSYFYDSEIESFFETVVKHKYKVLLIDSFERKKLKYEKRTIIDIDLCEF